MLNERNDISRRMQLKENDATFKFTSTSAQEHISKLEMLILDMESAGCRPDEEDLSLTLLRSLPSKYDNMVQAIRMSELKLNFLNIVGKILSEEIRSKGAECSSEQIAMQARWTKKDHADTRTKTKKGPGMKKEVIC